MGFSVKDDDRFMAKVKIDPVTGCWEWMGCLNSKGYGVLTRDSRRHLAHRYAVRASRRRIRKGYQVDHKCFNRRCVNPSHLEAVTCAENNRRMRVHYGIGKLRAG